MKLKNINKNYLIFQHTTINFSLTDKKTAPLDNQTLIFFNALSLHMRDWNNKQKSEINAQLTLSSFSLASIAAGSATAATGASVATATSATTAAAFPSWWRLLGPLPPSSPAAARLSPEYVILESLTLPWVDLYLEYLLNLLNVISWTILAKSSPPPANGKNSVIFSFSDLLYPSIYICTSSSQEIYLPRVRANTSGKMKLPQVIANLFKIWKMHDHWNTQGKARVYPG